MNRFSKIHFFIIGLYLFWVGGLSQSANLWAEETSLIKIAVPVSLNIRPYQKAAEGLSSVLTKDANIVASIYQMDDFSTLELLLEKIKGDGCNMVVAVGPEAMRFIQENTYFGPIPKFFTMVLNPEKIVTDLTTWCGVSTNIPIHSQLLSFSHAIPEINRIGLLFTPKYNKHFYDKSRIFARALNLEIVPLEISAKDQISEVFNNNIKNIDGLWFIPDWTINSESIIKHLIKQSLMKDIPVFGYNKFFYENGAAITFVLDYKKIGKQSAEVIKGKIINQSCITTGPYFETWINQRVANKLKLKTNSDDDMGIIIGP